MVLKHLGPDLLHAAWNIYNTVCSSISKQNSVSYDHIGAACKLFGKPGRIIKCMGIYFRYTGWNLHLCQLIAMIKCTIINGCHAFWDNHFL